jgi:hypothetical protein
MKAQAAMPIRHAVASAPGSSRGAHRARLGASGPAALPASTAPAASRTHSQIRELPDLRPAQAPGPGQAGQHQRARIFDDGAEDHRRQEGVEGAADHAAQAHPDVELGQPCRLRTPGGQGLVTDQGGEEEGGHLERGLDHEA